MKIDKPSFDSSLVVYVLTFRPQMEAAIWTTTSSSMVTASLKAHQQETTGYEHAFQSVNNLNHNVYSVQEDGSIQTAETSVGLKIFSKIVEPSVFQ